MSWVTSSTVRLSVRELSRRPLLQLGARDRVERRERLVEQEHRPLRQERAGKRDPLAHPAGQLIGPRG